MFVQIQKRTSNLSNFSILCYSVLCEQSATILHYCHPQHFYFCTFLQCSRGFISATQIPLGLKPGTEALITSELCFAKLKAKHPSRGFLKHRGKQKKNMFMVADQFYSLCRKNPTDFGNPEGVGVQSIMMADSMECSYCI